MNRKPCPYCGGPCTRWSEFMHGCNNPLCTEKPHIHDPVGQPDMVDAFWDNVQATAPTIKKQIQEQTEAIIEARLAQIEASYKS